eukprot:gene9501-12832_t
MASEAGEPVPRWPPGDRLRWAPVSASGLGRLAARPQTIRSRRITMPKGHSRIESVIGLDIAQKTVTLHDYETGGTLTTDNTADALSDALAPL